MTNDKGANGYLNRNSINSLNFCYNLLPLLPLPHLLFTPSKAVPHSTENRYSLKNIEILERVVMVLPWIYLALAVVCEIVWALTLKNTQGFTRLWSSVINLIALGANLYCIAAAFKALPVAIAYPIWTGLGSVGVVIFASLFFKEKLGAIQIVCIIMIVLGTVGLKLSENH